MTDINQILEMLSVQHVLWETYAFYDLFFSGDGIVNKNLGQA